MNELIECHGVVATCAAWATLQMWNDIPVIFLHENPVPTKRGALELIQATALRAIIFYSGPDHCVSRGSLMAVMV